MNHPLSEILPFFQVILLDICLSGDNAVVIAMAAMYLPIRQRTSAILLGTMAAVLFRIAFSLSAVYLLHIPMIPIIGAFLLFWVAWNMFQEIVGSDTAIASSVAPRSLWFAVSQIIIADVSMSLDNVLAVAAAAKDHVYAMIVGLVVSISLMAVAAKVITRFLDKWPILKYAGLVLILWVAGRLLFDNYEFLLEFFQ